jgi:hypothetical protein
MQPKLSINENELDGALNAFFLERYSRIEDVDVARLILEQDYNAVISEKKEKRLLAKLNRGRRGPFLLLMLIGLFLVITLPIFFHLTDKSSTKKIPFSPQPLSAVITQSEEITRTFQTIDPVTKEQKNKTETHTVTTSTYTADGGGIITISDTIKPAQNNVETKKEVVEENKEKKLPYFDEVGLAYFQMVKDQVLKKILKLDNQVYARIDPGVTNYKGEELAVPPFVLSNHPVTNLQYKVFLADLFREGKMADLEKCLPKQDVWKDYGCTTLAKNYFENESYNDFPVVNVDREAIEMFCKWLEEEMNGSLNGPKKKFSKNSSSKQKHITVRLPYDYEWIYAVDAYYALIPDCGGYNTIYDVSEGLVDKNFFKRTSQISKHDKNKLNRIDKLSDVNRYGMTEAEMIAIFKEAISFKEKKADPADPYFYPGKMEDCCLAGHVGELINTKSGGTTIRGCCWKDKEEYLKMTNQYKKQGASPFVGFRVVFITNGTYKDPFWNTGGK